MNEPMVKISKGPMKVELPKDGLLNIIETSDGIIFKIQGGTEIIIQDLKMPTTTKQIISTSFMKVLKGSLTIDLLNYKAPVSISID